MSRSFAAGDRVLLIDPKKRRYLITLKPAGEFHSHSGFVPHDSLIDSPEGATVQSTKNVAYLAVRPTLSDFVLKMPRGAQVIYPKDLGPILMHADIFPGARVLESGVGSGALSMAMLRAGADIVGSNFARTLPIEQKRTSRRFLGRMYSIVTALSCVIVTTESTKLISTAWSLISPSRGRSYPMQRRQCIPAESFWHTPRASCR